MGKSSADDLRLIHNTHNDEFGYTCEECNQFFQSNLQDNLIVDHVMKHITHRLEQAFKDLMLNKYPTTTIPYININNNIKQN